MFYLKTKYFSRWARKEGVSDGQLRKAIKEFYHGQFEADLGDHLFKKRIPLHGKGKRGGARTVLFYQKAQKLIFCFGFAKNVKDNLDSSDLKILNKLSDAFQCLSEHEIVKNIKHKEFIEITKMEVSDEK